MNIAERMAERSSEFGEYINMVCEGREFTNVEIHQAARKLANALRELGIRRGDRVIIQLPNCPEVFQGFGAVWSIGATVVPVNYLIGQDESAYIYKDCGAETLISSLEFLPRIQACREMVPAIRKVILIEEDVPKGCLSLQQLVDKSSEQVEIVKTDDDEIAALVYTAGTTGKPKGVIHSHYSLYANAKMTIDTLTLPEKFVGVFVLPLCHIYGITAMIAGSVAGSGKGIVLRSFGVEQIFEAIERYRANLFTGVPTMYILMLLSPENKKYDLSSMQRWISAGSALALETWKGFKETFGFEIIEAWGLTESGGAGTFNPFDGPIKVGSIGKPIKGAEMKVVDNDGKEVPRGSEGEIIIRSPGLMKGYWNQLEQTAEVLREGWLYTGDIGYVDDDGYFFITERKKDIIIKAGENISPREIEEVIFTHPRVLEAAAVGIKDDIYGEDIKAFVVLKPGEHATADEIIEYCRAKLKTFKTPKEVKFVEALPKNLLGKVLRRELRNLR
jgi:long-chain acyl-CoA synthetase